MTTPQMSTEEVIAALSERGQLEWELAAQRVLISKLQQAADTVEPADAD